MSVDNESFINKFKVFELIEDVSALKVLLILESPHINEYIHGHPAAGESALELTQWLKSQGYLRDFDAQLPVGCNIKTLHYKSLGILNCSTLPMNKAFYPCTLATDDLAQVDQLVSIKQSLAQNSLDTVNQASIELAEKDIFQDFANRLNQVLKQASSDLIIVPCGDTAVGFMSAYTNANTECKSLNILHGLPHPTGPEWHEVINIISLIDHIPQAWLP